MTTFSRHDWEQAQTAWADFSEEWAPFRKLAAHQGFVYPPAGTKWDGWDDDHPSQRAILIRAIRETPQLLAQCVLRSRNWAQVVSELTASRDEWRARARAQSERDDADSESRRTSHAQALKALQHLLEPVAGDTTHILGQLSSAARVVHTLALVRNTDSPDWESAISALGFAIEKAEATA